MLCSPMLCSATLCCAMLCSPTLGSAMLCPATLCSAMLCSASTLKVQNAAGDISTGRHAGYQHVLGAHPLQRQQADKAADGQSWWECFGAHDRLLLPLLSTCGGDLIHSVLCHPSKEHPQQAYGRGEFAVNSIHSSIPAFFHASHASTHSIHCFIYSSHSSTHSSIYSFIRSSFHAAFSTCLPPGG